MATLTRALARVPLRRRHAVGQADAPLESYVRFAKRQWVLIADGILAGVLAVAIYLITTPVGYQGDVTVTLNALPGVAGDGSAGSTELSVDSDAQVATSARALKAAAARVHYPGGDSALAGKLHLTARPNSRVLTIAVRASSAGMARDAADAVAAELLRVRGRDFSARLNNQRTALKRQIQVVTTELAAIAPASTDEIRLASPEATALLSRLSALQLQAAELDGQTSDPGFVTAPASAGPSGRSGVQAKLASGAMIGLLAGLALAWLRDRGAWRRRTHLNRGPRPAEVGTR